MHGSKTTLQERKLTVRDINVLKALKFASGRTRSQIQGKPMPEPVFFSLPLCRLANILEESVEELN